MLQVFLNTNLRVKPCYCVTSFLFILISSLLCLKSFFNDCTKLQGSCSSCGSVQLCVMEERASWLLRVMTCQSWHVMWCWHLLATAPQKKKKLLSEKVPLRYRWKLTANEGQRKRERTFAAQQMEADCKARAVKEDKYRALTFILLFYFFEREDIMRNYKFKSDLQNLCLSSFRLLDFFNSKGWSNHLTGENMSLPYVF